MSRSDISAAVRMLEGHVEDQIANNPEQEIVEGVAVVMFVIESIESLIGDDKRPEVKDEFVLCIVDMIKDRLIVGGW